jgi:hypothetical protein
LRALEATGTPSASPFGSFSSQPGISAAAGTDSGDGSVIPVGAGDRIVGPDGGSFGDARPIGLEIARMRAANPLKIAAGVRNRVLIHRVMSAHP